MSKKIRIVSGGGICALEMCHLDVFMCGETYWYHCTNSNLFVKYARELYQMQILERKVTITGETNILTNNWESCVN